MFCEIARWGMAGKVGGALKKGLKGRVLGKKKTRSVWGGGVGR